MFKNIYYLFRYPSISIWASIFKINLIFVLMYISFIYLVFLLFYFIDLSELKQSAIITAGIYLIIYLVDFFLFLLNYFAIIIITPLIMIIIAATYSYISSRKIFSLGAVTKTSIYRNKRIIPAIEIHLDKKLGRKTLKSIKSNKKRTKYFKGELIRIILKINEEKHTNEFYKEAKYIVGESIKISIGDLKVLRELGIETYSKKWYKSIIRRLIIVITISFYDFKNGNKFIKQVMRNIKRPLNGFIIEIDKIDQYKESLKNLLETRYKIDEGSE